MHYHAYTWTGGAAEYTRLARRESHIDQDRFARSPIPPIKSCWWLRKPPEMVAATLEAPEQAADWLAGQYRAVAGRIGAPTIWTDERRPHAQRDLADGRDITWQWHLDDGSRAFATVVACSPNAWDAEAPCPLG